MNHPQRDQLRTQVQDHFASYELTEKQLANLEHRQNHAFEKNAFQKNLRLSLIVAASLMFLAFIGYFWRIMPRQMNLETLPQEIAYHHNKHMDSEIITNSYSTMKGFLSKLDFNLIESKYLPLDEWELVGGRYCSLQGRLAAQIKVRNKKSNKFHTLYQLALPSDLKTPIQPFEAYAEGAKVKIWSENDLLLGIAGDE